MANLYSIARPPPPQLGYANPPFPTQYGFEVGAALMMSAVPSQSLPMRQYPSEPQLQPQSQSQSPPTDAHTRSYEQKDVKENRDEASRKKKRRRGTGSSTESISSAIPTTTAGGGSGEVNVINRVPPAKERRRTQMRLAQRAYRQRKQHELSTTQRKLSCMGDAITELGTTYVSLNSRLATSGLLALQPDLARDLQEMAVKFQALIQMSSSEEEMGESSHSDHKSSASPPVGVTSTSTETGMMLPHGPGSQPSSSPPSLAVTKVEEDVYPLSSPDLLFYGQGLPSYGQQVTLGPGTTMSMPTLPAPVYLSEPSTYSFQETTFARRLQRTCIEKAYRILLTITHPAKVARVFKLIYRIWSKDHLLTKFRQAISSWELDDPSTPFFAVGGAATHYPRRSNQLIQPVTNGPWPIHMAEIRQQGPNPSVEGIIRYLGMNDCEWYDAYDIEGYLRDMGIFLEGHTAYAEFMQGGLPAVLNVDCFIDRLISKAVCLGRSPGFRKDDVVEEFYRSIES
ncbi:hypothetical protein BGW36DRAFT_431372 [Talaromyces proteolyticus]|uniref:BZIP domain-containing protein n=1 Tax=Talaromyces proteolyticus TaxID=1131652 RepID=A0AAD4KHZ8_9EURO|nr:uncharacterized protein BGW36DRAFT_431372 [Talaromyces proteolyticus]KAH8692145.1 hypothetical protein BGW36DRAFT_431372 [Talaromyces proteolyticus]